jgi:PAS domain S-box-containing protein/putative nucleotidyltransferase with HDIG domain
MKQKKQQIKSRATTKKLTGRYWALSVIAILGLTVLIIMGTANRTEKWHLQVMLQTDASMDIQIDIATFHLWFEEYLDGDKSVDLDRTMAFLDSAEALSNSLLTGGKTMHGRLYEPLESQSLRDDAEKIKEHLVELRESAVQRLEQMDESGIGTVVDQRFDDIFVHLQEELRAFEYNLTEHEHRSVTNNQHILMGTFSLWLAIIIIAAIGVIISNRRRRQAEKSAEGYLELAGVMFVALDSNGIVTLINGKGCEILGYECSEIVGKNWFENFLPESIRDEVASVGKELLKGTIEVVEYFENPILTKSGEERIVAWHNTILRDNGGNITGILSSGTDITERKRAEEALAKSEERFALAMKGANDGVWDWNLKTDEVYYSPRWKSMLGYAENELEPVVATWERLVHPKDIELAKRSIDEYLTGATDQFEVEFQMKHKDGSWVDILARGFAVRSQEDGKPVRLVGTHVDITKRKKAEEEILLHSEIMKRTTEGVYLIRMDGTIVYTNPKFEQMFGYEPGEMTGKNASIVNYPTEKEPAETAKKILAIMDKEGVWSGEIQNIRKDGTPFWSYASVIMFDHSKYGKVIVAVHKDITERKRAEVALQDSQASLVKAQKVAHIGSWNLDLLNNNLTWSDEIYRIFGIPIGTPMTYEKFLAVVYPADRASVTEEWSAAIEGKPYDIEHRLLVDNKVKWVREKAELNFDEKGNAVSGTGIVQDITERKMAELELVDAKARMQTTFDISPGIIAVANVKTGYFTECNRAVTTILGYSTDEFMSVPFIDFIHPDDREPTADTIKEQLEGTQVTHFQNRYKCKDGSYKWLAWQAKGADKFGMVYAVATDVTQHKLFEEERERLLREAKERVKELQCLYSVAESIKVCSTQEEIFRDVADLIPPGWQYPEITRGKVVFDGKEYVSEPFEETEWKLSSDIIINNVSRGSIEVYHMEERPELDEGPFLKEERNLINGLAKNLSEAIERKQAEEALKESEYRMSSVTNTVLDAIIMIDNSATVLFWNPAAERLFGYTAEEAIGASLLDLVIPERYLDKLKNGFGRFSATGEGPLVGKTVEMVARSKDGTEFPISHSISAVRLNNEWCAVGITRDITDQKRVEERILQETELTRNLLRLSEATSKTADIDELMEGVVTISREITGVELVLSYRWDAATNTFRPSSGAGLTHDMLPFFRTTPLRLDSAPIKDVMDSGNVFIEFDTAGAKELQQNGLFNWVEDKEMIALLPLVGKREYLGLIVCICTKGCGCVIEKHQELMQTIVNQVSTALEEALHYKESINKAMELSQKIETIETMSEISKSILSTLNVDEIFEVTARMVSRLVPCDWVRVIEVDKDKEEFEFKAGFEDGGTLHSLTVPFALTSLTEVVDTKRPEYIPDLRKVDSPLGVEIELAAQGYLSVLRAPVIVKGEVTGVLGLMSKRTSAFGPEDLRTIEKLASQIGVAIENARLVTDLEDFSIGTVKALAGAIDAKSPWTHGHSERVTELALKIGKEMGFGEAELKEFRIAGLLHDIGKIGTYESILDKPSRLTEEEYNQMKEHPVKGEEILLPIKQLSHILPVIRGHHEFYDGTGYPDGLKGTEIPFHARILTVADTIDAMGADRPYRKGLSEEKVIAELKRCSGKQFDPEVVTAYLNSIDSEVGVPST